MVGIYLWKKVPFCHKSHQYCGAHCLKGNQHGSWDDLNFRWALGSWWGGNVNVFWSLPVLLLWYWIFIFGNYNVACPISACTILWQPYWTWSVLVLKSVAILLKIFLFFCLLPSICLWSAQVPNIMILPVFQFVGCHIFRTGWRWPTLESVGCHNFRIRWRRSTGI